MATNIDADDVRYAGNWDDTTYPDPMLNSKPYIPAGDAWLEQILSNNSTALASLSANQKALALAAEAYFVASLVISAPPKEDFEAGPVKSIEVSAKDRETAAKTLLKQAKELLNKAGIKFDRWTWGYAGGDSYHPDSADDTNVDFRATGTDRNFDILGGDEGA